MRECIVSVDHGGTVYSWTAEEVWRRSRKVVLPAAPLWLRLCHALRWAGPSWVCERLARTARAPTPTLGPNPTHSRTGLLGYFARAFVCPVLMPAHCRIHTPSASLRCASCASCSAVL